MHRRLGPLLLGLALLGAGCNGATAQKSNLVPQAQPGDMALDYVTDAYPSMLVEVAYISGYAPSPTALAKAQEIYSKRLLKPKGVEIVTLTEIPASQARPRWSVGDILTLEAQYRRNATGDEQNRERAVIWMVYLNGNSEFDQGSTRALGISYDPSSSAIFAESIAETSAPEVREVVEALVLIHEGGHLFGLVNNGLPMVDSHEDPASFRHDSNPNCVMFHQIETQNVLKLSTAPPYDYDYECRLDLFWAGGPDPGPREPGSLPANNQLAAPVRAPAGPIFDTAQTR
jgi:hypothetical protein